MIHDVKCFPLGELTDYIYTVIFARHKNKWLYCRHKNRDTFETAGGQIETNETPLESAKRELFEETGAVKFDITPVFDYSVNDSNGQAFLAHIHELGDMPDFEMAETALFDTTPEHRNLRFPQILPVLYDYLQELNNA